MTFGPSSAVSAVIARPSRAPRAVQLVGDGLSAGCSDVRIGEV